MFVVIAVMTSATFCMRACRRCQVQLFATLHVLSQPGSSVWISRQGYWRGCQFLLPGSNIHVFWPRIEPEDDPGIFCIGWVDYLPLSHPGSINTFACTANYLPGSAGWFQAGSFPAIRWWQELDHLRASFLPGSLLLQDTGIRWRAWPSLSFLPLHKVNPGSTESVILEQWGLCVADSFF